MTLFDLLFIISWTCLGVSVLVGLGIMVYSIFPSSIKEKIKNYHNE